MGNPPSGKDRHMLTFNKKYFALTLLLFATECLIALYIDDAFIRPYFGDVLVVILMYCFVKSFVKIPVLPCVVLVLLFSFAIEILQYLDLVEKLHLEKSRLARTVLGSSFSWADLLAYAFGAAAILLLENRFRKNKTAAAR